ncbi:MAG: MarR family winged helix-turn-helix transcriptional regulator [Actinomycetota bacterium]|nr:MarR family winged helix-turn-helix transcriptional regulator [Actinomycetota bacterium]
MTTTTADPADIPELMMRLMRQHMVMRTRLASIHRGEVAPSFLLAKLGEGPRRAAELAAELCADPSTVSRQVASMVREKLVERQADPLDGRASILVLTEAGFRRREELIRRRSALFGGMIHDWSKSDQQAFTQLLGRYVASLEEHRDDLVAGMSDSLRADAHHFPTSTESPDPERHTHVQQ